MHHRKAVSVLPLPVGARISVESPRAIAGQPWSAVASGRRNEARNQSATARMEEVEYVGARHVTF